MRYLVVILGVCVLGIFIYAGADQNADPQQVDIGVIDFYLRRGDVQTANRLILAHEELAVAKDPVGDTLLHRAAEFGSVSTASILLDQGAATEAVNIRNESPLHVAAIHEQLGVIELLLNRGVDIDSWGDLPAEKLRRQFTHIGTETGSALDRAAQVGATDSVAYLLSRGAKIDSSTPEIRFSALHHAASGSWRPRRKMIQDKLNLRVSFPTDRDPGEPPEVGNRVVVDLLMEHGADARLQDYEGREPIHIMAETVDADCLEHFLKRYSEKVDVNAPLAKVRFTPLMIAVNSTYAKADQTWQDSQDRAIRVLKKYGAR